MEQLLPRIDRRIPASEKWACTIAGGLSLFWGLKRRGFFGSLLSLAGVELLTYGISGHHTHELLGIRTKDPVSKRRIPFQSGIQVEHTISINAPIAQVYSYFRDFENLPLFMRNIRSVQILDQTHSHWSARGPLGAAIEWDAEIISDEPNKLISWRSTNSPDIENAGSVHFHESSSGRGTTMRVELQYLPPAGAVGAAIARLFGEEPEIQLKNDLRRFKQQLEGKYGARSAESDFERTFQSREAAPPSQSLEPGREENQQPNRPEKARGTSAGSSNS